MPVPPIPTSPTGRPERGGPGHDMSPERWKRVKGVLYAARELEGKQRARFLDEACQHDTELRREMEELLVADEQAGSFMEHSPHGPSGPESTTDEGPDARPSAPTLEAGRRLGPYEIKGLIAVGGMGEVYRASDPRLGRDVAVKVVRGEFSHTEEARKRFEREARAVATLSHPNILSIYDVGSEGERTYAVMELLDGETLRDRLQRGPLPWRQAVEVAEGIALALAAAHSRGIVHRDLKPANVFITTSGWVKVLDFGLAKLREAAVADASASPTLSRTASGWVLGTPGYMAPEQLRGRPADERSDIFAVGCVLYELVSGRPAFERPTVPEAMAAILNEEPPELTDVPAELVRLIALCLKKDPAARLQSAPELALALKTLGTSGDVAPSSPRRGRAASDPIGRRPRGLPIVAGAGLVLAIGAVALVWLAPGNWRTARPPAEDAPLTSYRGIETTPALSPDGDLVAFSWNGENEDNRDIYVKQVGMGSPVRLTTDRAQDIQPVWSPDGRLIAFLRRVPQSPEDLPSYTVHIVPALGGPERKVTQISNPTMSAVMGMVPGLSWSMDGKSLAVPMSSVGSEPPGLFLVSIETGERRRLTASPREALWDCYPVFSPDGRNLAFLRSIGMVRDIYLAPATGGPERRLTFDSSAVAGLAWTTDSREIVFSSLRGRAAEMRLWRVPATGSGTSTPELISGLSLGTEFPTIAGGRLAYNWRRFDPNLWRLPLSGPGRAAGEPAPLVASSQLETEAQFSPDTTRIAFRSDRSGSPEIWLAQTDGSNPVQLTSLGGWSGTPRWSLDGQRIVFDSVVNGNQDVYVVSVEGGQPRRLTDDPTLDNVPTWSRDGRWIYFASQRTGDPEIWKMPAGGGQAVQVTRGGGFYPQESPDGRFLYYVKGLLNTELWRGPGSNAAADTAYEPVPGFPRPPGWGAWVPTAGGIYGIGRMSKGVSNQAGLGQRDVSKPSYAIQFYDVETRQLTPVYSLGSLEGMGRPAVSPDGRWLVWNQLDKIEGGDLRLVENFR
jgi:eukaryotic-like serine/threonine-protein kinase